MNPTCQMVGPVLLTAKVFLMALVPSSLVIRKATETHALGACILATAFYLSQGCAKVTAVCEESSDVGTVGPSGAPILAAEVEESMARVKLAGGRTTRKRALKDLLWQEAERQRLGLDGGEKAPASRRAAIVAYQASLKKGATPGPPLTLTALPPNARLSKCGEAIMKESD